jgi:hypothetical protein
MKMHHTIIVFMIVIYHLVENAAYFSVERFNGDVVQVYVGDTYYECDFLQNVIAFFTEHDWTKRGWKLSKIGYPAVSRNQHHNTYRWYYGQYLAQYPPGASYFVCRHVIR